MELENIAEKTKDSKVQLFKQRMLNWQNPVEYVNNMYGSHPGDDDSDYFRTIYAK